MNSHTKTLIAEAAYNVAVATDPALNLGAFDQISETELGREVYGKLHEVVELLVEDPEFTLPVWSEPSARASEAIIKWLVKHPPVA